MSVLSVPDAKVHLNISSFDNDAELQDIIDAAEAAIAQKCGPLEATAVTERVNGGSSGLVLKTTPVISLTSVTPVGGSAYTITDLQVDSSSGVVEWVFPYGVGAGYYFPPGRYDVAFSAGRATVPADLLFGVKELVRHVWEGSQRGPVRRPGSAESAARVSDPGTAVYLYLHRVQEFIEPHIQVGN